MHSANSSKYILKYFIVFLIATV